MHVQILRVLFIFTSGAPFLPRNTQTLLPKEDFCFLTIPYKVLDGNTFFFLTQITQIASISAGQSLQKDSLVSALRLLVTEYPASLTLMVQTTLFFKGFKEKEKALLRSINMACFG